MKVGFVEGVERPESFTDGVCELETGGLLVTGIIQARVQGTC